MRSQLKSLLRQALKALAYGTIGASLVSLIGFVVYLNGRTDLNVWHRAQLDEEFTARSGVRTFTDYLALEDRLFRQLDERVYARVLPAQRSAINRYNHGSLSDPQNWKPNWNRSFELPAPQARAGVLQIPASEMLRLRWNPFYRYVETRVLAWLALDVQQRRGAKK